MFLLPSLPFFTLFGPGRRRKRDIHRLRDSFGVCRQNILVTASPVVLPHGLQYRNVWMLFLAIGLQLVGSMVVGMVAFGASMFVRAAYGDALLKQWS